jgi:hypothetical protein
MYWELFKWVCVLSVVIPVGFVIVNSERLSNNQAISILLGYLILLGVVLFGGWMYLS